MARVQVGRQGRSHHSGGHVQSVSDREETGGEQEGDEMNRGPESWLPSPLLSEVSKPNLVSSQVSVLLPALSSPPTNIRGSSHYS